VWRVLSDPASAASGLPFFCGWIGEPPSSSSMLAVLRFRSRLRGAVVAAEVHVVEVTPGRLSVHARFGLFAFAARFALRPEPGVAGATRIGMVMSVENEIAVVGGTLDRFEVRRLASDLAEATLVGLSAQAEDFARLTVLWPPRAEAGGLLERVRDLQHAEVVPAPADDLDADGQAFRREAGGH
jgi:hypothetical protein